MLHQTLLAMRAELVTAKIFEAQWLAWSMLPFSNESDFSKQFQPRLRLSD